MPGLAKSNGRCSEEELQKPRWRVAVRRCLEFSRAQRWRAEPLWGFRTTRPSSARRSRERGMLAGCASQDKLRARCGMNLQRLCRSSQSIVSKLRVEKKLRGEGSATAFAET